MKKKQDNKGLSSSLGRRRFLHGASFMGASLAMPKMIGARGIARSLSPQQTKNPVPVGGRETLVWVNMRGGPDGIAFLAPADDQVYKNLRDPGPMGTQIDDQESYNTQITSGTVGRQWWLPHALTPLVGLMGDLALIPAVGLKDNINKSHFVAMDRMEFGTPPSAQGYANPITDGFMARMLKTNSFSSSPVLRGWVASKLNTTAYYEAPKSLAIPNVENFNFPGSDAQLQLAVKDLHNEPGTLPELADASNTAFDSIAYLNDVFFVNPPSGLSPLGNGPGEYPTHPFGVQLRRAAAMILHGNPPEAIEIDIGSWDHHDDEGANPAVDMNNNPLPGGTMWGLMDILSRALAAFHGDLKAVAYPFGSGQWMDHTLVAGAGEFGRRVEENGSNGTDHGKGGVMWVLGGTQVIGGVYDSHWTGVAGMTDGEGDIIAAVDYRDVLAEIFVKRMQVSSAEDVWFANFNLTSTLLNFLV